jgi:AcrR family transcriptional regulator
MSLTMTDDVSDRLRRVIRASGHSQREFATIIGLDPTALSKSLRGTRRWRDEELRAAARAGSVPLRYLTTGLGKTPARLARVADHSTPPERLDPEQRRAQILAATAHLIARRGIHSVRVADIARECGTSTGTVHYHFPTKAETLRAALGFYADRLYERLEAEFRLAVDGPDKLRRLIEVQLPAGDEDRDEWSVWIQSWTEAMLHPSLREEQARVYARWQRTVLEVLQECGFENADALASRFTALVDGLAVQILAGTGDMTVDRMRTLLRDAFTGDSAR